jgi:hypothetical protein
MSDNSQFSSRIQRGSAPKALAGARTLLALGLAMWSVTGIPESIASADGPSEYQVKAAFLYNFAKFVEWPSPPQTAIELCVVGEDPFGKILEDTVQGKTINGQPMVVRRLKAGEVPRNCQIAFVNAPEREARSILDALRGAHTLTVGESPSFAQDGGIINFVLKDNRVQFEINIDAAEQARLKISSKLLSLAKIVRNGNRTGEP